MMNRKFAFLMILIMVIVAVIASPVAAKTYKIGVILAHNRPGLQADQRGFAKALKEAGIGAEYDQQNAQDDPAEAEAIAGKFVADKVDLVHAIGLTAAQVACKLITDIPVVYSSVRDPVEAGLVKTMAAADGNVTGATAGLGVGFLQVGYTAGHKAASILKGEKKPGQIPSGPSEHPILYINLKNAKKQGVAVAEEFVKRADKVFK